MLSNVRLKFKLQSNDSTKTVVIYAEFENTITIGPNGGVLYNDDF